ncbi:hypothetical protein IKN40_08435 [bacterium]|nr:hypothetical protein [bacterium]
MNKLIELKMLPEKWANKKEIKKRCKNIAERLNNINILITLGFNFTPENLKEQEKAEKIHLEEKDPKTDEDIRRLQALEYLEANPDEAEIIHKNTVKLLKDEAKYI